VVSSMRRAAIVLMSLPLEDAAQLIGKLAPGQAEAVSIEIAQLRRCSSDQEQDAILAFAEASPNALGGSIGGVDVAKSLPKKTLGKRASASAATVQQSIEARRFGFLTQVDPQDLLTLINDEHPQTIALILSHVPPAYGAQVVAGLTTERQLTVLARIANMEPTDPEIIAQVEDGLEKRMVAVVSQPLELAGGVGNVVEILSASDQSIETAILDTLAADSPELADEIRRRLVAQAST
jgi:flagellar motor switch protein FliG